MGYPTRFRGLSWIAVLCVLTLAGVVGCGDDEDKNLVVVGVTATPALLGEGDIAIVEALVTNRTGSRQDDETVYFSVIPAGAGVFSVASANTNGVGVASATFTAILPGTALIGARVGNNPSIEYGTIVIEGDDDDGGGDNSGQLVLTVTPSFMPADGQSTASVLAQVTDQLGNPVANGTVVKFTAGEKFTDSDHDGLWTENVDQLDFDADGDGEWDPYGHITGTVTTSGGQATATFTAGNRPGLVHIKVTVGDAEDLIADDITILLTSTNPIASIVLTPEWQQVQVRGTGGIEWAQIVAETFDEHGNPAAEGEPIDFTILSGPGGGETIGGDAVGPVSTTTNSLGQAVMTLNAGTLPGTVRVRARSGAVISTATQVTIRSGPPAHISCGAEQCNAPSWELIGYENKIIAVVVDEWGNEVPDSTSVYFGTEQGLIEGAAETQAVPTVRGKAITYWNSAQPKNDEYVYIWCETAGGTIADTSFFWESGPPATGGFIQVPTSLPADGTSEGFVIIEVLDINGGFVHNGTQVDMYANIGSVTSGQTSDGCHTSTLLSVYVSETLDRDHSCTIPDDGIGAIATVTALAGGTSGFNETAEITLTTGPASSSKSSIDMVGDVPHGLTVPVEVVIKDSYGNPLSGHLVEVTAQRGTINGTAQYTNCFGVASGFEFTAPTDTTYDAAVVIARDVDPVYGGISIVKTIRLPK